MVILLGCTFTFEFEFEILQLSWRRRLWVWEEDLVEECRALLFGFFWFQMFQINGCGFQILRRCTLCEVPMTC